MKFKHFMSLVMIVSLMICSTSYAAEDEGKSKDITEYTILNEDVNMVEDDMEGGIVPYSDDFTSCRLILSSYDSYLHIYFFTGYSKKVSQIGMYNFKLQKKVWYGWKDVFTRSELSNSNAGFCSRGYDLDAEHGETYRLKGTHFVVGGGTVKTLTNSTPEVEYK